MSENRRFADQARKRTTARAIGFGLLAAGLVIAAKGGYEFLQSATLADVDDTSGFTAVLLLGGGGFLIVFGLAALSAGYLGATARYSAGETMPVAKDSAAYLSDGHGLLGVGRTVDDTRTGAGPYCTRCGARNDEAGRFCVSCGHTLG